MGFLQFGHRIDRDVMLARRSRLPFRHPALDAVRQAVQSAPDVSRPGWAADAVGAVREPYRSLAAELLTADFPALTDEAAVASTADLARRLAAARARRREVGAARRDPARPRGVDGGPGIRLRLRELDLERQRLAARA